MSILYLGPGIGIGSIISVLGVAVAIIFVVYSFVILPLRRWFKNRKKP